MVVATITAYDNYNNDGPHIWLRMAQHPAVPALAAFRGMGGVQWRCGRERGACARRECVFFPQLLPSQTRLAARDKHETTWHVLVWGVYHYGSSCLQK
jgi:hypothetical protein